MAKTQNKKDVLKSRPPVVVILGHVDHGKSSILEAIKDLRITAKESGGITQHIGAYEVEQGDKSITFLDTPGHEAFSAMRSRGAKVADIAILVVAADEGVKPQTKEAILHIKESKIPFIVALNKIDRPGADTQRVKGELAKEDVLVESMGGKVPSVNVSAQTQEGIEDLLEMISLLADLEDLSADYTSKPKGIVIESYQDSSRGATATLLLNDGVLNVGDIIATKSAFCKVKNLENFQGKKIEKGLPGMPVIIFGFDSVPRVGEEFKAFESAEEVKIFMAQKEEKKQDSELKLDSDGSEVKVEGEKNIVNLILKADVVGSLEAIEEVLKALETEQIGLKIIKSEVGDVSESDVKLAKSSRGKIMAFRVKITPTAKHFSEREKINIMTFEVIYEMVENLRKFIERITKPEFERVDLGKIKILAVFLTEKNRQIVGGKVIDGEPKRAAKIEILRQVLGGGPNELEKLGEGKIINLQRDKKNVEKISKGSECGLMYEGSVRIQEGDIISFYEMVVA